MPQTAPDLWPAFATPIIERLGVDDDPALWQVVVETIIASTEAEAEDYSGKDCIIIKIGRCSHWIRPHWRTCCGHGLAVRLWECRCRGARSQVCRNSIGLWTGQGPPTRDPWRVTARKSDGMRGG